MPLRRAVLALVAVAAMSGATGCEKQNPYITLTAHGVVVKARAFNYCRGDECDTTTDSPKLTVRAGDTLGIDVPRSVADHGWRIGDQGDFSHDHYRAITVPELQRGSSVPLTIFRDPKHGVGEWRFTLLVK